MSIHKRPVDLGINLFMPGFPKCGTTSLAHYFSSTDKIFVPKTKEPGYWIFGDETRAVKSWSKMIELYKSSREYRYVSDCTVSYIYEDNFIENFTSNPASKAIFLVRYPPLAMVSMFNHNNRLQGEDGNIINAIENEGLRLQGINLPPVVKYTGARNTRVCYKWMYDYESRLKVFCDSVPKNSFLILTSEYLWKNTVSALTDISSFLELDLPCDCSLPHANPALASNNRLASFLAYPPAPFGQLKTLIKQKFNLSDTKLANFAYRQFMAKSKEEKSKPSDYHLSQLESYVDIKSQYKFLESQGALGLCYWKA